MSMSSVEREDRQTALAHAVQLAATGRTDPTETVSYAEDFLAFLRADAPAASTTPPTTTRTAATSVAALARNIPYSFRNSIMSSPSGLTIRLSQYLTKPKVTCFHDRPDYRRAA